MDFIKPKEFSLPTEDGGAKTFILSKFPAVDGREIVAKYPLGNMPKIGDYEVSKEVMLKLMAFVGVQTESGAVIPLKTAALVNNHCESWETLARLEWAMLEYNVSFFGNGALSTFFDKWKAEAPTWISRIVTGFSAQLSEAGKQRSTS